MANLEIEDPTPYIETMGSQTSPYQWLRELVMNSTEAKATWIEVNPFNDVLYTAYGADKMVISDNGIGMAGPKLVSYMRHLLKSGKSQGGVGEHMGIGARISTLAWNRYGVVVISVRDGETNMVWMHKDPVSGRYALADFEIEDLGYASSVRLSDYDDFELDGVVWENVIPDQVKKDGHGTVVVLLGNEPGDNSNIGDPRVVGEGWKSATTRDVKAGVYASPRQTEKVTEVGQKFYKTRPEWNYLDGRFWVFKHESEVPGYGTWTTSPVNSDWQAETIRAVGIKTGGKNDSRMVVGGLASIYNSKSEVTHGVVDLPHPNLPARVHWFLRSEVAPTEWRDIDRGYISALYQDEIYERNRSFRLWGVSYRPVQDRVFLIVEPLAATGLVEHVKGSDGVRPNAERSHLLWGRENQHTLPWEEWGQMFRSPEVMPAAILEAIKQHVSNLPASENVDPEIIRRVMDHVDATYETEDEILRRKVGATTLYAGTRSKLEPDPSGAGSKTEHEKVLVRPRGERRPAGPPLPEHEDGDTPAPVSKEPVEGTVPATHKTRPVKITARRKADAAGALQNKKGTIPGELVTKKGSPPLVRWVMQADIAAASEEVSGVEDHAGALWDPPAAEHPAGLLRLAKDHWAVDQVIERVGKDLPHVDEVEIRNEVQDALAGAILLRVLSIRKQYARFGSSDTLKKMLDTPSLTGMLLMSHMEYDAVTMRLKNKHGVAPKIHKVG